MQWSVRPDLSCDYLSPAWLHFTAILPSRRSRGWPRGVHPEDLTRWLDRCLSAFDEREPFEIEYRLRAGTASTAGGGLRHAALLKRGVFLGYAGCCIDIDDFFRRKEKQVNWDRIQGNWKQMTGSLRQRWGKLTDDEFEQLAGHKDKLVGKLQERYGLQKDEAERR